jgi:hypothetical protein
MATTSTEPTFTSGVPCPVAKLPVELREMIYDHYFKLMDASRSPQVITEYHFDDGKVRQVQIPDEVSDLPNLRPYFNMLHLSSIVRSETSAKIYKRAFTNLCFNLEVDSTHNDIERVKIMLMTVSKANEDVEFGLRFHVRDCGRDVFLQLVESVTDIFASDNKSWPDYDPRWSRPETGRVMDTDNPNQKVEYEDESDYKDYHRLWVFGALARYDWSALEFTIPFLIRARASDISHLDASYYQCQLVENDEEGGSGDAVDDEYNDYYEDEDDDTGLDSENEVVVFDSDDDEDDEDVPSTEDKGEGETGDE